MKLNQPKEWYEKRAEQEEGQDVSAGINPDAQGELQKAFNDPNPNHRFFELLMERDGVTKTTAPDAQTERIDAKVDEVIKLPVRYDRKGQCIRHGDLGAELLRFPARWGTSKEAQKVLDNETHQRGEYVAECINSHVRLQSALKEQEDRIKELEEAGKQSSHWCDNCGEDARYHELYRGVRTCDMFTNAIATAITKGENK